MNVDWTVQLSIHLTFIIVSPLEVGVFWNISSLFTEEVCCIGELSRVETIMVFDEIVKVVEQIVLLPSWSSTSEEEYSKKQSK